MTGATTDTRPRVSVIIPTLNGARWLDDLLTRLREQTLQPDEILVVDSGSTDATLSIAARHGVHLLEIPPGSFDHGGTRSLAVRHVQGDLLVFLTQDAVPADREALARLVHPFAEDALIAAAYGRQLANPDATPCAAHLRLFNYPPESAVRSLDDRHRLGFKTIFISNSFAAYRREPLERVGCFPEKLLFGEDTYTVAKLLELGYCVAYASDARVYHSHNYTLWQECKRYFDIGAFHASEWAVLGRFGAPTGAGSRYVRSEIAYLLKERHPMRIPESLVRNGLKLTTYLLGRRAHRLPRRLARSLSLHPLWWD